MKKQERRAFNSSLRPMSPKKQKQAKDGTLRQEKYEKAIKRAKDRREVKGTSAIERLLGEGKIKKASQLERNASGRSILKKLSSAILPSLDAQLTELFSKVVRARSIGYNGFIHCFICGKPVRFNEAVLMHFMPRKERGTRFHPVACRAGCQECNNKPNGDRKNFARRLNQIEGEGTSSRMAQMSKTLYRFDRLWYQDQMKRYKAEWKELKKEHGL